MENTKESILKAALSLFACKGYLGTSMSDIAAAVGLTKAALYKHYEGKQKILESVVNRMRELDAARATRSICRRGRRTALPKNTKKHRQKKSAPTALRSSATGRRMNFRRIFEKC